MNFSDYNYYTFDWEIKPNYACVVFKSKADTYATFRIYNSSNPDSSYSRNDIKKILGLLQHIIRTESIIISYNGIEYDNLINNYLINNQNKLRDANADYITKLLWEYNNKIINTERHYSKDKYFKFIDIYKMSGLHKKYKSLKEALINIKWHKIQDFPLSFNTPMEDEHIDMFELYCKNDVDGLDALRIFLQKQIDDRFAIYKHTGNVNVITADESKLGDIEFERMYCEELGVLPDDIKSLRTNRGIIKLSEVIQSNVKFNSKKMNLILEQLQNIEVNCDMNITKLTYDIPTFEYGGIAIQLGAGGIHSVDKGNIFITTDIYKIKDIDVASEYPNAIVKMNVIPEHIKQLEKELGKNVFIPLMERIIKERIEFKHAGIDSKAYLYKIMLNSRYGKLGSIDSWLYDRKCVLQVTINCQLYMLMLVEMLVDAGIQVISMNTDGITCKLHIDQIDKYREIYHNWEKYTGFQLEENEYIKYIRMDINAYIATYIDKGKLKIKRKGRLNKDLATDDLRKAFDMPVIPLAVEQYFLNNIPVVETITNHKDIYDFCTSQKIDKKFQNKIRYINLNGTNKEENIQRSVRFYVSKNGYKLYKVDLVKKKELDTQEDVILHTNGNSMSISNRKLLVGKKEKILHKRDTFNTNGYTDHCAGQFVTLLNDYIEYDEFKKYNINYDYYINEANKLIQQIKHENNITKQMSIEIPTQLRLF
jgi:hypothetical protein